MNLSRRRFFAPTAIFVAGACVGAMLALRFTSPHPGGVKLAKPPRPAGQSLSLSEALEAATALLAEARHIEGREIGACWRATENGSECIYVDIWPAYEGDAPPANHTRRLVVRVDHATGAGWHWMEGTGQASPPPDANAKPAAVSPGGRRRVVLPPAP